MGRLVLTIFGLIGWKYSWVPHRMMEFFARRLGDLLRFAGIRSKVVRENLEKAYPGEIQKQQRERIFRAAYWHLGDLILGVPLVFGAMEGFVRRRCELRGQENWLKAHQIGKGVIFLSSHVGNWEIMSATGSLLGNIDLLLVTKKLKPAWLHRAFETGRFKYGVKGTYEPRTLRDVFSHLKNNGTVGIVLDQYAGPPVGVRVPVFGTPVSTSTALATLAKRTGAVVLPVVNYRTTDGRWISDIGGPIPWETHPDANMELAMNTANYARCVEKHIYDHPEQWLWTHRRFKGDLSPLRKDEWIEGRARA